MTKTLLLVDGTALAYRNLLGMPPLVRKSDGVMTGAAVGFINQLHRATMATKPTHGVVAFDADRATFRKHLTSSYKAQREGRHFDDEALTQLAMMRDAVEAMGFALVESPLYEADDLIATYATKFDGRVFIIAADKDMLQLVSDRVCIYDVKTETTRSAEYVREKWGIEPHQAAEYQALTGDGVDNVAGVHKLGPVAARKLLVKYGTLARALDAAFDVEHTAQRQALATGVQAARHSANMVRLECNAPLPVPLAKTTLPVDRSGTVAMLKALEANASLVRICRDLRIAPGRVKADARWTSGLVEAPTHERTLFG